MMNWTEFDNILSETVEESSGEEKIFLKNYLKGFKKWIRNYMDCVDKFFAEYAERDANGTLTVGTALIGNYYRIMEGVHAGRVIIKARETIDDRQVVRFANGLTWINVDQIRDVRVETVRPTFGPPRGHVDYSKATWYPDNGSEPMHYEW